jgi:FMN-dependent NADH-azoreductase
MKLLHIDSSITGEGSASRQISAAIVEAIRAEVPGVRVTRRDLETDPIPHLGARLLPAVRPDPARPDAAAAEDVRAASAVLDEFLDADVIVIGAPMYNFTVSTQLKAWLDRILIAGKTFGYTEAGPKGLAGDRRVIIASTRGGLYGAGAPGEVLDFQEKYLAAVFAFIGVTDLEFVRADGLAYGPEPREAAIAAALASIPSLAASLALAEAA